MRIVFSTLSAIAALSLTAAPVAAQDEPSATMQESVECMLTTLPFLMVASVDNPDAVFELESAGKFWADYADLSGDPSEAEVEALTNRGMAMVEEFRALESAADFPAFLAPYQAKFDACEELRKALQAG